MVGFQGQIVGRKRVDADVRQSQDHLLRESQSSHRLSDTLLLLKQLEFGPGSSSVKGTNFTLMESGASSEVHM